MYFLQSTCIMKLPFALLLSIAASGATPLFGHGPGHIHRDAAALEDEALDLGTRPVTGALPAHAAAGEKSFTQPADERSWGGSLTAGWESRHVHYGLNESGDAGACTTELNAWIGSLMLSVWSGFGTGSEFQEWDFTAGYQIDIGPVFAIPGYNFRYAPAHVEAGHSEEDHEEHSGGEHHEGESHAHQAYGNELFFALGTRKIPYVTPTMNFVWDLNNTPGAFVEFRLDGEIPVYRDIVTLEPYGLLGINLGYNTKDYYGWNNLQFGLRANWKINRHVSVFAGINYSVAMTALREIGQGNEGWANAGLTVSY